MVRYDDLIKYFRKEFKDEETLIKNQVEKELRLEREEELAKKAEREEKKSPKKEVKEKAEDKTKLTLMKICYERVQAGEKFRPIGRDLNLHKDTVKKYAEKYADELAKRPKVESDDLGFGEYFGEGIMPEEIEDNFG